MKLIIYMRASTTQQINSVAGQELAIKQYCLANQINYHSLKMKGFVFIEDGVSGTDNTKQLLLKQAIEACYKHKLNLLVVKIDRISRNLAYLAKLREEFIERNLKIICTEGNYFDDLMMFGVQAVLAQYEIEQMNKRQQLAKKSREVDSTKVVNKGGRKKGYKLSEESKRKMSKSTSISQLYVPSREGENIIRLLMSQGAKDESKHARSKRITDTLAENYPYINRSGKPLGVTIIERLCNEYQNG